MVVQLLVSLDDAKENTGVGSGVFNDLTSGDMCTAIGFQSLYSNTTGSYNNALGTSALRNNTTGTYINALGTSALYNNTTGSHNNATGYAALYTNTTGSHNNAIGNHSLRVNTTGNFNTAIGHTALRYNTTGSYNNALGASALFENTTGSNNIANGFESLFNNTTGKHNTAYGHQAGNVNVTGDKNTYIGHGANAAVDQTALSNSTAIGYDSKITASNQIMLGTADETVEIPGNLNIASDKIATAPTVNGTADNTNNIATTAFVQAVVATVDAGSMSTSISNKANIDSPVLTGIPEAPTADNTTDTDQIATTKFVQERITTIIGGAPAALDTLNELANALGSDDNFAGTIATAVGVNKTAIETEEARAIAAEGTLQTNINAVSGNLSLNGLSDVKSGGDDFANSLLIGTTTTGTLDAANNNIGVGQNVFYSLTSGDNNLGIGYMSLYRVTSGNKNVGIGSSSGLYLATGDSNVCVGHNAGYSTTGNNNVYVGCNAGYYNQTGEHNTYLGYYSGPDNGDNALSNSTAIGYNSKVTESNQIVLGTAAEKVEIPGTELNVGGDIIFTGGLKQDDGAGNLSDFRGGAFNIVEPNISNTPIRYFVDVNYDGDTATTIAPYFIFSSSSGGPALNSSLLNL